MAAADDGGKVSGKDLSQAEVRALWREERKALRIYALSVTVLAAALGLTHVLGGSTIVGSLVTLAALALVAVAVVVQFRVRCPRCGARLATQSPLILPDHCHKCGAGIAHPASLDGELDA